MTTDYRTLFAAIDSQHEHAWAPSDRSERRFDRRQILRGVAALGVGLPLFLATRRSRGACSTNDAANEVEGPYHLGEPEARTTTGSGLIIRGTVSADGSCQPLQGARIVRWHSNKTGIYEDYYRATMTSDGSGAYAMQTIVPGVYAGLPRHVHFHISAPGYQDLITQIRWPNGAPPAENVFNFVLKPV